MMEENGKKIIQKKIDIFANSVTTLEASMKVDIEELKKEKETNFKERLDFIDRYVEWIKATPNKVWSKQHKDFINSAFQKQLFSEWI